MPRHFLPRHMTTLFQFQMPLQVALDLLILRRHSQQPLMQELIRVHRQQLSRLPLPKVKVLQRSQRLQWAPENVIKNLLAQSPLYPTTNAQNVPKQRVVGRCSLATSKLIPGHTNATSWAAELPKQHSGILTVTKTPMGRSAGTFAPSLAARGTLTALDAASQEDWTTQRGISSHISTTKACLC